MTERESLAPGHITAMKPDDSERDYRECVVRMEEAAQRLKERNESWLDEFRRKYGVRS